LSPNCSRIRGGGPQKIRPAASQARASSGFSDVELAGDVEDGLDVEVGADRLAGLADLIGFVGLEAVQRVAVFV
jgi:hypothetical protein